MMIRAARSASIKNGIGSTRSAVIAVRMNPGETMLTITPAWRNSILKLSRSAIWAALLAQ